MRLPRIAAAVLWSGCVVTPSTKTGDTAPAGTADTAAIISTIGSPTGDTGTGTPNACAAGVELLWAALCVESTAPLGGPTTHPYYTSPEDIDATGSGSVTEVGGVLAPVPGSAPVSGFEACGADHVQQVRLVDQAGDTWTIGWGFPDSPLDDRSADGIGVGEALDFLVRFQWWTWSSSRAVLLSDAGGPRVVFESHDELTDAQLGGVVVDVDTQDVCYTPGEHFPLVKHYRVTLTGSGAPVDLRSGQQATVATPGRDLDFTLTGSFRYEDCADGCGGTELAAWETP